LSDRPTYSQLVEIEKQRRITTKPCTEGSGTTDTMPSCIDAAPLPEEQENADVHTPAREWRESDDQGKRNAGVDEGHQGYISPSARKREEYTTFEQTGGRKCRGGAGVEQGNRATT
jgi:hypothetical protein